MTSSALTMTPSTHRALAITAQGNDYRPVGEIIDEIYAPDVGGVIDALNARSMDERDVVAIVNTHLHFDHCGQNDSLPGVPVWVRADEVEAARTEGYTVPEWATRMPKDGESLDPEVIAAVRQWIEDGALPD